MVALADMVFKSGPISEYSMLRLTARPFSSVELKFMSVPVRTTIEHGFRLAAMLKRANIWRKVS